MCLICCWIQWLYPSKIRCWFRFSKALSSNSCTLWRCAWVWAMVYGFKAWSRSMISKVRVFKTWDSHLEVKRDTKCWCRVERHTDHTVQTICEAGTASVYLLYDSIFYLQIRDFTSRAISQDGNLNRKEMMKNWNLTVRMKITRWKTNIWVPQESLGKIWKITFEIFWDNPIGFQNPRILRSEHDPRHHVTTGCSRCLRQIGDGIMRWLDEFVVYLRLWKMPKVA